MRIVAFITEVAPVERTLIRIGEPLRPPPITPARGPPDLDDSREALPDGHVRAQPAPKYQFDQRLG